MPNYKAGIFGACGLAAYLTDQFMNYEFMIGLEGGVTSLVIAVPIAGLLCCVSWGAVWRSLLRGDLPNALLLSIVFISLAAFSLGASVFRAGEAYDKKMQTTASENLPVILARRAVTEAKADWIAKDMKIETELENGGCGRICRDRKGLADDALERLNAAKAKLALLGVARAVDPMASRLADIFNIPEKTVQRYFPLSLPIGIWLASISFAGLTASEFERRPTPHKEVATDLVPTRVHTWMAEQQAATGKRPTQAEAAAHFRVSKATISRRLNKRPAVPRLRLVS